MGFDLLTFGEALVEVMRTDLNQPLNLPGPFIGPYPSGAPFIFAVQVARLGAKVGAIGAVGEDAFGQCLIDQLEADGVDARCLYVLDTHSTGVAFISYKADGSRDFVFHIRGAAAGQLSPEMLKPELFEDLKCLHITGSALSIHQGSLALGLRALEMAQAVGAKISFDANVRPQLLPGTQARTVFAPFVQAADLIFATPDETLMLTGAESVDDAVSELRSENSNRPIIIHAGKDGCRIYTTDGVKSVPGFPVQEVDPTGAGDCFDAGFLLRWLSGDSLEACARFGNACGALAVTEQGPMSGAKTLDEVLAFLQNAS
jgi:tagatose kinase